MNLYMILPDSTLVYLNDLFNILWKWKFVRIDQIAFSTSILWLPVTFAKMNCYTLCDENKYLLLKLWVLCSVVLCMLNQ